MMKKVFSKLIEGYFCTLLYGMGTGQRHSMHPCCIFVCLLCNNNDYTTVMVSHTLVHTCTTHLAVLAMSSFTIVLIYVLIG